MPITVGTIGSSTLSPSKGGGASALAAARRALEANAGDVNVLVFGDSTGNDTNEWVYLAQTWLSERYPAYSASYRRFNDGSNVYDAATVISTGSGANTLRFWNASVSGANLYSLRGSKFAPIAVTPFSAAPDLVIVSLGENSTGSNGTPSSQRGQMIAMIEEVMLLYPGVPIAVVLQNPWRDGSEMDAVIASWRVVGALRPELTLIDVHSLFIAAGKNASLYIDSVHPSAAGSQLYLQAFQSAWNRATALPAPGSFIAWLTNRAANDIALNGDFAAFASAVPDSFTLAGTGAVLTKDTGIKAPGKAYSVKLINGTAASHLRQVLNPTQINLVKGNRVTLAVSHYIDPVPAGTDVNTGRIRVFSDGTNPLTLEINSNGNAGQGAFRWDIITGVLVPADATVVWLQDFANSSAGTTKGTIYIDEIRLFLGDRPGA